MLLFNRGVDSKKVQHIPAQKMSKKIDYESSKKERKYWIQKT